jgi:hypothetical protein
VQFAGYEARCEQILKGLEQLSGAKFFLAPVDLSVYSDYTLCVPHPMDFATIRAQLGTGPSKGTTTSGSNKGITRYSNHNEFANDVRRVCGNFMRYNYQPTSVKMRKDVGRVLLSFEAAWQRLASEIKQTNPGVFFSEVSRLD